MFGNQSDDRKKKTAIVIGGSIAGVLAARVLSDFFERVMIIE
jgi:predicted flavoprotein YhiN